MDQAFWEYSRDLHGSWQVLRNARWSEQDADMLVPGDIISIKLGDIIPADARLLDGDPLKVDQVSTAKNQEELLFCNNQIVHRNSSSSGNFLT